VLSVVGSWQATHVHHRDTKHIEIDIYNKFGFFMSTHQFTDIIMTKEQPV